MSDQQIQHGTADSNEEADALFRPMQPIIVNETSDYNNADELPSIGVTTNGSSGLADVLTTATTTNKSCPCALVLPTNDSVYCGLCSVALPVLMEHLQYSSRLGKQKDDLNRQLTEELVRQEQLIRDNQRLTLRVRELEEQLEWRDDEMTTLRKDIQSMSTKMIREIERRVEISAERDRINQELEELTSSLFEQANVMVADEAKRRHQLQSELQQTRSKLETERVETLALRRRLLRHHKLRVHSVDGADCMKSAATTLNDCPVDRKQQKQAADQQEQQQDSSNDAPASSSSPRLVPAVIGDTRQLLDSLTEDNLVTVDVDFLPDRRVFEEFCVALDRLPNQPSLQKSLSNLPFLKSCYEEFVEPCARLPRLAHKKIIEGLLSDTKQFAARLIPNDLAPANDATALQQATAVNAAESSSADSSASADDKRSATPNTTASSSGAAEQTVSAISTSPGKNQFWAAAFGSNSTVGSGGILSTAQLSPPSGPMLCGGCGKSVECPYQLVFTVQTGSAFTAPFSSSKSEPSRTQISIWLDTFCRDRWLAVIEFFEYLHSLYKFRRRRNDATNNNDNGEDDVNIAPYADEKDLFLRFIETLKSLFYARIGLLSYVRRLLTESVVTSPESA